MKKFWFLILVLSACSSQPDNSSSRDTGKRVGKTSKSGQRKVSSSEEDLNWVEQLDFDKKKEEKYSADKDEYRMGSLDESTHALVKESLATQSGGRLEDALRQTDDPLIVMNIKCYQGKFEEALKIADDQYSAYKNNTSYWNQLGSCYFLKSDYAKAILFYNKSRDLDKKYVPPINNLGVVYQRQGKFQKALTAFKLASDLNSFAITPTYNLAYLYLRFGTVGKALPVFQGLQRRSPKDPEVNAAVAAAFLMKGDYQEAAAIYSRFDKSTLSKPAIGLNYAVTLKLLNRPKDAQTVLGNTESPGPALAEYAQKVEKFIRN